MSNCPTCTSAQTVKNGRIHNGKQRFSCRECGRQFVEQPTKKVIDAATRELIDRLLARADFIILHCAYST